MYKPNTIQNEEELEGHKWNMSCNVYTRSLPSIDVMPGCFGLMFTNLGDTIATVNDMVIFPSATPGMALGDSRSVGGHWLDIYRGNISIKFIQPVGVIPRVEIVQLFYVKKATTKPR